MQIILTLERAGAQEVVRTLVDYLQTMGCSLTVCAFRDGPMREEIENLGVKVEILERPRYSVVWLPLFLIEMWRIRRELARLVKKYNVEVAQTHLLEVLDFLVLTLRYDTPLRVVLWTIQNVEFLPIMKHRLLESKRRLYRWLYRLTAGLVDGFIVVSDQVREALLRQVGPIENKIITIPNAVDVRRYERPGDRETLCRELGIETNSHLVATAGRLTEQKGHRYLIEAATDVVSSYPDTHFLFAGVGELAEGLRAQAQKAGLSENVHFLGIRSDIPDLLAAIDVFVLPSLWEGLSLALLEAMAAGKPIVATAVSGTTQAMIPGQTGLVVPPRDGRALAEAILEFLSDPAQAQAMGQAAQKHVISNFSAQKQAEEHLALYRRLLAQSVRS
jgi:glycosyltransferase involved in cell wall biosynthesis